jgi:secreted trypsin-like serine protease
VGGTVARRGEHPSIAFLSLGGYMCGGSLIHKRAILTASHCVEGLICFCFIMFKNVITIILKRNYNQSNVCQTWSFESLL